MVVSAALGREGRCSYRPLRLFARRAARAGIATVRFDPLGEGGSQDLEPDGDALEAWTQGLHEALDLVRRLDGVRQTAVVGVRSGALLACTARSAADRLYLLAPTLSGRSWLAKLRFSVGRRRNEGQAEDHPGGGFDAPDLWVSPATLAALAKVNLMEGEGWPQDVFLAANGGLTSAFEARLRSEGVRVRRTPFPELESLFLDPNINQAPSALFQTILADLQEGSSSLAALSPQTLWRQFQAAGAEDPVVAFSGGSEAAVRLPAGGAGVVCRPLKPSADLPGLIFLNTGADPMAGVGRFAVQAQRHLAAVLGATSLRFDFAGVGDSDVSADVADDVVQAPHVYETSRQAEVSSAKSVLQAQGCTRFVVVGISAGAYHAVREMIADQTLDGAFAISPLKLVWRSGDSLAIGDRRWGRASRAYFREALSVSAWLRLLRGEIAASPVIRTLALRLR